MMPHVIRSIGSAALVLLALGAASPAVADLFSGTVRSADIRVIDGDTIEIANDTYRLVGFDTPETWKPGCAFEKALGEAATAALHNHLDTAYRIDLIVLPGRDRYDRGLARLMIDGRDTADILIGDDLARAYDGGRRSSWCN